MLADLEAGAAAWERAHEAWSDHDPTRAIRCAFWLGMQLINGGEMARGGAWIGRAAKRIEDLALDCAEAGLIKLPMGLRASHSGDHATAMTLFSEALEIGRRHKDEDVIALGTLGVGTEMLKLGDREAGLAALDEAMVAVTTGDVTPTVPGIVYCAVILECFAVFDLPRAREWTAALDAWSAPQQGLVPFRGQCLVHRSQVMQSHGAWDEAFEEALLAKDRLADPPGQPAIGLAYYQLGELHRVRGSFVEAEEAYREANAAGRPPQPGLALLRLAQGKPDVAATAIATALQEATTPMDRARHLPAAVEIALTSGDVAHARRMADELAALPAARSVPLLRAESDYALGAVSLAEGAGAEALPLLRRAQQTWLELDVPFDVARARVAIGRACDGLGDAETASLERDAARRAFAELGAGPALTALDGEIGGGEKRPGGLTGRELEILRLVAAGKTNPAIAEELVISRKTVARHVSNIFTKIGVSTRAEATAYAFRNDLV